MITICILHIMNHPNGIIINHFELLARIFIVIVRQLQSQVLRG
jgi:hypothetical protein